MERLGEELSFSSEKTCPYNLSGCGFISVVDDFSVRFFPGLGNQSLAFCVWAFHSFRLLYLRTGLQYLEEYARILELRLAVGCCVHRFPSFSLFLHVMWLWWRERDFSSPTRSSSSSELGDAAAASPRPHLFLQGKAHLRHGNICAKSNQSACESWGLGH